MMKSIKIVIAVIAVLALAAGIYFSVANVGKMEKVEHPENAFTQKLDLEINSLQAKSSVSLKDYSTIKYHIDDYHSQNRLGVDSEDTLGNDNNRASYSRLLYSVYVEKFVKQSLATFNKPSWPSGTVSAIYSGNETMLKDGTNGNYLDKNGRVYGELKKIRSVTSDYIKINKFINTYANGLSASGTFPVNDVSNVVSTAQNHLASKLGGTYGVNDVSELSAGLNKIPSAIFQSHCRFIAGQIESAKSRLSSDTFSSYNEYKTKVYDRLSDELSKLSSANYGNAYNPSSYSKYKSQIEGLLSDAYDYFYNH